MFTYKYKRLMADIINEVITVEDFERDDLNTCKNESERMDTALFSLIKEEKKKTYSL